LLLVVKPRSGLALRADRDPIIHIPRHRNTTITRMVVFLWQGLMSVKITLEELAAESDEQQAEVEDEIREIRELLDS